ncbi:DEAD/DEAH box helicase [Variovorax saccharolyticus]|uniref:DEAD/DEAH box helicase n=1 Tax=Variovorax saccharolyticus TaxID=3053516 RepID=UPI0025751E02|nr:DEAD/DEAH box helicase [Variovorax sp. J31P216]MDM0025732.1 DEAD/DEAH box helicase [Variovorax sp. J31P216]
MRFEDLLARADSGLADLMPPGATKLVTAIDPQLAYPKNLLRVLLRLRPPAVLLEAPETRAQLLMLLPVNEARVLASRLGSTSSTDTYAYLARMQFRRTAERAILFDFFGVGLPEEEERSLPPALVEISPTFGLFPHQARALRHVERLLDSEPHRALLHMPTGSGKTRTAMNVVVNHLRCRERGVVVWLAHSEELCEQAAEEFSKAWRALGTRPVPLVRYWGAYEADLRTVEDGIVVAGLKKSVSRLRTDDHQFRAVSARNPLVVMDEAHQAIAPTYQTIINQLLRPLTDARLLGLSATPGRTWNDPEADRQLSEFFASRKVTLSIEGFDNPVAYLIDRGYLAQPTFTRIETAASVSLNEEEQRRVQDTFELPNSVLERLAADEQRTLLVVHHAEQLLKRHQRVILFAASVQQSDLLAAVLSARSHWAASITSESPSGRAESIAEFKEDSQEAKILCNYGVLTTGFDAPRTSAALIARPTLSLVLYSQMVGRAMRGPAAGGNENCEILTVVDPRLPGFDSVVNAFTNWEDVWRNINV